MMDYPCAKFGNFSFSRFGFIVRTDRQTDRITEADDHYTYVTTIGVTNDRSIKQHCVYTTAAYTNAVRTCGAEI